MDVDVDVPRAGLFEATYGAADETHAAFMFVLQSMHINPQAVEVQEKWKSAVMIRIRVFCCKLRERFQKCARHKERFLENYKEWLTKSEPFPPFPTTSEKKEMKAIPSTSRGRPRAADFENLNERSKRARTKELRTSTSMAELNCAAQMKLRESGRGDTAKIVKRVVDASPKSLQAFSNFLKEREKGNDSKALQPYSTEEALAHQFQCKLSKAQYIFNRQSLKLHNAKVFPAYDCLTNYKQANCYPPGIEVSEIHAKVPLQALLDHTVKRIAMSMEQVLIEVPPTALANAKLISKIGFDASTQHSLYNQVWESKESSDNSMLLTSIVPLMLHGKDYSTGKETIIWLNQRPSSTLYCRPLELEFTKETTDKIKKHCKSLKSSIKDCQKTTVEVKEVKFECSHEVLLTMVDGKVASAATEEANQNCNVCHAKPSLMNKLAELQLRKSDSSALDYGLSVLHAHIRFLEYMLNIAYRLDIKKGYCVYTNLEKMSMSNRKKEIQKRVKDEIGLNLDQPGKSGGNTNTGNNARRFFENSVKVAEITGINLDILKKIRVILRTLSCGYSVDPEKYHEFAIDTAKNIVEKYPWYYMPASVHKVLLHGAEFIRHFPVPLGMLSEEALESRHKDLRYLRLHHARKSSRVNNLTDIMQGLLAMSDPAIAFLRNQPKPKGQLSTEVRELLAVPKEEGGFPDAALPIIDEYESEDEDPDDWGL